MDKVIHCVVENADRIALAAIAIGLVLLPLLFKRRSYVVDNPCGMRLGGKMQICQRLDRLHVPYWMILVRHEDWQSIRLMANYGCLRRIA